MKKFFMFFILISIPSSILSLKSDSQVQYQQKLHSFEQEMKWHIKYNQVINYIKEHEGFMPVKYKCAAGVTTIGYGHVLQTSESLPEIISEKQADLILRKDFDKALRYVTLCMPHLSNNQKLAMSHFVFSLGIGRFNQSNLKQAIINNEEIDTIWLSYCYYKIGKAKKIRSDYAYKIRKWELELFKSDN
jgi:lysozyme